MKHVKKFEQYDNNLINKTNEEVFVGIGGGLGLLLWYGVMYGYVKISNLFNSIKFKIAINKIEPIFNKIKDDEKIQSLLKDLYEYKDGLYFGEEQGPNPKRTKAFETRDAIYQRAKELLNEKEFDIFKSSAKEFEEGSEKPAGYFTDKDSKFQGFKYTV